MADDGALTFRSDPQVDLVDWMGSDASVVSAARVSVVGSEASQYDEDDADATEHYGLINYLMANRHGTPFEHNSMKFRIEAPIFVFREFHRHRIGWSYNEMSGRYTELAPTFHIPGDERPLVNAGSSARPRMERGTFEQWERQRDRMMAAYEQAYATYLDALKEGVAKEVAREVLPVGIFSTMYATANARSIMAFLSLRTHEPEAAFPSRPQYEIEQVARCIEALFAAKFPLIYKAFDANGRVAP